MERIVWRKQYYSVIGQTYSNEGYIVVDGGSSEGTVGVLLKNIKITLLAG